MSRTQMKHYHAVWEAAVKCAASKDGIWKGFTKVGEVMKQSGLSRPTVIKYLNQGCTDGYFEKIGYDRFTTPLYKVLINE